MLRRSDLSDSMVRAGALVHQPFMFATRASERLRLAGLKLDSEATSEDETYKVTMKRDEATWAYGPALMVRLDE